MVFLPAERFIIAILGTLVLLDVSLLWWKSVGIDVVGYASMAGCGLFAMGLGQFYRTIRRNDRIAATTTAAGLFILFTIVGSIFNYLLLPVYFTPIDDRLMQLDRMFGYSWPDLVAWTARHPTIGLGLHAVYMSSLSQLLVVIFALGFTGRIWALHHFLMTGVIGALLAIVIWFFAPSIGPSAFQQLPQGVLAAMPLAVDNHYGAELSRLLHEGPIYLTPRNVLGLIAFPSFHMVMACMSVCFLARARFLFLPTLALNAAMMPAILVHGGHHLVDLIGGAATFAIAYALAARVLNEGAQDAARDGAGARRP
jgi:hypothetical protein